MSTKWRPLLRVFEVSVKRILDTYTSRGVSREDKNCNEMWNEDFSLYEKESNQELNDFILHSHF